MAIPQTEWHLWRSLIVVFLSLLGGGLPDSPPVTGENPRPPVVPWIADYAPVFRLKANDIHILRSPAEYIETIQRESSQAKERIVIACFHTFPSQLMDKLIPILDSALTRSPGLRVRFLLDYGYASTHNLNGAAEFTARQAFLPLIQKFGPRAELSLYHSPDFRGLRRILAPNNSLRSGVQHIKTFVFDQNVILTSANIDFLTHEQNRYMFLKDSGDFSEFCVQLVEAVSTASFQLQPDDTVALDPSFNVHPYNGNIKKYKAEFRKLVEDVMDPSNWCHGNRSGNHGHYDTWIVPLVQMAQFGISLDLDVVSRFLRETHAQKGANITIVSPYLHLPEEMLQPITAHDTESNFRFLVVNQESNPLTYLGLQPSMMAEGYANLEAQLLSQLSDLDARERYSMYEYMRDGWTFHSKGIWYYPPGDALPAMTFVGSSNYNERWKKLDLDAEFVIVTNNEGLRRRLDEELNYYLETSEPLTMETLSKRQVPLWMPTFIYYIKNRS